MLTTILLDLDDTLLDSNMKQFVPAYVDLLADALSVFAPKDIIKTQIRVATAAMQINGTPDVTNHQAFLDAFLPILSAPLDDVQPVVDQFYQSVYPSLQQFVTPIPIARTLITHLFEANYNVVIATNPLFPRTAIEQRLAWTDALDFPYALITHAENMHACKPSPNYYREILDLIDAHAEDSIMVGDSMINDMEPGHVLGLKTWWITEQAVAPRNDIVDHYGPLTAFLEWMSKR